jgi:hypothetical protein
MEESYQSRVRSRQRTFLFMTLPQFVLSLLASSNTFLSPQKKWISLGPYIDPSWLNPWSRKERFTVIDFLDALMDK